MEKVKKLWVFTKINKFIHTQSYIPKHARTKMGVDLWPFMFSNFRIIAQSLTGDQLLFFSLFSQFKSSPFCPSAVTEDLDLSPEWTSILERKLLKNKNLFSVSLSLSPLTLTRLFNCFSETLPSICTRLTEPSRLPLKFVHHVAYHLNFIIGSTLEFTTEYDIS